MSAIFKALFLLVDPFVMHPERAYLVAGLFGLLLAVSLVGSRRFTLKYDVFMLLAVLAWGMFGLIEQQATAAGWNIRVDLFVSVPLVLVLSVAALWAGFRSTARGLHTSTGREPPAGGPRGQR